MMKEKDELTEFGNKIERGLEISFEKLIAFKKYKETPFVFQKNAAIVEISADKVEKEMKLLKKAKEYKREEIIQLVNEPSEKKEKKK